MTSKAPSQCYSQAVTFLTPAAIKRAMFGEALLEKKSIIPKPIIRHQAHIIEKDEDNIKISEDNIIFIRNNYAIISLINNYRKQNAVQIYIFIEPNNFVSLIAKNASEFPLILLRIPIDDKNCFAKQSISCYEFPIDNIASRITKDIKSTYYTISYKRNETTVDFSLIVYGINNEVVNDISISGINVFTPNYISSLLEDDFTLMLTTETSDITMMTFLQMGIIMLKHNKDSNNSFSVTRTGNTEAEFVVEEDAFKFILSDNRKKETKVVATRESSLVWAFPNKNTTYKLEKFISLFKAGFSKPTHHMNQIYYVFTKFVKWYLFIKIVTPLKIEEAPKMMQFGKLFNSCDQIIECYACNPAQEE